MTHHDTDMLLRLLDGDLSAEDETDLRQRLDASPALRAELEDLHALRGLLQTTVHASSERILQPFFTDRLMRRLDPARLRRSPDEEFFGALLWLFRPVAVAGMLLILVLAAYNVMRANDYEVPPSTTEAVFGLPPVSLATAYEVHYLPGDSSNDTDD